MSFDSNLFCERANELFGNIKQEELAKNIGLSQGVISAIRNYKSKVPASDTVFKIANKYNVSADWLLGLSDVSTTYWECKSNDELFDKDVVEAICHLMEALTSVMDINTNEICAQISNDNLSNWLSAIRERIATEIQNTTKIILKAQGDNKNG